VNCANASRIVEGQPEAGAVQGAPQPRRAAAGRCGGAAVEGAHCAAHTGWLATTRTRIGERRGRNIAAVAVARKLLTLIFYGLRDGHIRALSQARKAPA
jgi:hypothetical protein